MLFSSIASEYRTQGIGIILSGTGSDGSIGLTELKHLGGTTIVQSPETAKYDGMPLSAIQTGMADYVLPPEKMGAKIEEVISKSEEEVQPKSEIQNILDILNAKFGNSFQNYKEKTIFRQIKKAIQYHKLNSIEEYVNYIHSNPEELKFLYQSFLIGVTSFFRDEKAFQSLLQYLEEKIKDQKSNETFRVWVIGCSTGEEAYTLAILINETYEKLQNLNSNFQVFATDIYEDSINFARKGIYNEEQIKNVPLEFKNKYFTKVEQGWEVEKNLRNKILFSVHNILLNPPFLKIDLISCRNLLIYLKSEVQNNLFPIFHYSLRDNGILFLGKSESIIQLEELFEPLNTKHKIFRKRRFTISKQVRMWPLSQTKTNLKSLSNTPNIDQSLQFRMKILETFTDTLDRPFVILNSHLDILETRGDLRDFLQIPQGILNLNISKLLRKDFQLEVKSLVLKCIKNHKLEQTKFKKFSVDSKTFLLKILVAPLEKELKKDNDDLYILIFEKIPLEEEIKQENLFTTNIDSNATIEELQKALDSTKEQLQTYIEELETSNEELQSLNEELQSANEELQATNEELQTSNEELQSSNEELQTAYSEIKHINQELKKNEEEILELNQIFSAFFENIYQANFLLEENLNIKFINEQGIAFIEKIFQKKPLRFQNLVELLPESLLTKMIYLIKLAKETSSQVHDIFSVILKNETCYYNIRVCSIHHKLEKSKKYFGITVIDVTELKNKENQIYKRDEILASFLDSKTIYLIRTDLQGNYTFVNKAFCEKFGYAKEQLIGKPYTPTVHLEDVGKCNQVVLKLLESPNSIIQVELRKPNPNGGYYETEWEFSTIQDKDGTIQEIQAIGKDITIIKQQKQELENQKRQLEMILWSGGFGTWDWDVENDTIEFNQKWGEILGFSKQEYPKNFTAWCELIHPSDQEKVVNTLNKVINGELNYYEIEYRKRNKAGTYKWLLLSGKAWERNKEGKATRVLGVHQDITQKIETEFREKIVEQRNQAILSKMNVGVIIYDITGMILFVNKEAEKILQTSSAELLSHSIIESRKESSYLKELDVLVFETIQTKKEKENVIIEIENSKGEKLWLSLSTHFLNHPFTELPYSIFVLFYDITNFKTIKQNLEEKQWLLSEIGKLSQIGAWEFDSHKSELLVTEEIYKILGIQNFSYIQKISLDDFLSYFLPEDRAILKATLNESVKNEKSFNLELKLKNSTEKEIWVRTTGRPIFDEHHHFMKVIGSMQNITEKINFDITIHERHKRIAAILDFLPFAVYMVDEEGFVNYINNEAQRLIDFNLKSQFQQWNILNGLLDLDGNPTNLEDTPILKAFHEKVSILGKEYIYPKENTQIYVLVHAIPFLDEKANVKGGISIIIDITKMKELENSLKENNKKLEILNKELNQFNYLTSHEMQEPLGNILASLDIIYKHYKNLIAEPVQKYLSFIQISTSRMKEQILAVLEYSLLGENLKFDIYDLKSIVEEVVEELKEKFQNSQGTLEIQALPKVYCSYYEIKLLFKHLILNALKFQKKDEKPHILIHTERTSNEYIIHVEDNGIGILEEYYKKIFQMFQRLHNRGEYEGIGIGLASCEKIVRLHNGKIWVSKSSLGGTQISFSLPKNKDFNISYEI